MLCGRDDDGPARAFALVQGSAKSASRCGLRPASAWEDPPSGDGVPGDALLPFCIAAVLLPVDGVDPAPDPAPPAASDRRSLEGRPAEPVAPLRGEDSLESLPRREARGDTAPPPRGDRGAAVALEVAASSPAAAEAPLLRRCREAAAVGDVDGERCMRNGDGLRPRGDASAASASAAAELSPSLTLPDPVRPGLSLIDPALPVSLPTADAVPAFRSLGGLLRSRTLAAHRCNIPPVFITTKTKGCVLDLTPCGPAA